MSFIGSELNPAIEEHDPCQVFLSQSDVKEKIRYISVIMLDHCL